MGQRRTILNQLAKHSRDVEQRLKKLYLPMNILNEVRRVFGTDHTRQVNYMV